MNSAKLRGDICFKDAIGLEGAVGSMDAQYYTTILEESLLRAVNDAMEDIWTLRQDNVPIHTAVHTIELLEDNDIHVLDCPARSPDLNITVNVFGMVVRKVYKDRKRNKNKDDLSNAIYDSFMYSDVGYIRNLYHSILRRSISVIKKKKRAMLDYWWTTIFTETDAL